MGIKYKIAALTGIALISGAAMAYGQREATPGGWHPLPVTGFGTVSAAGAESAYPSGMSSGPVKKKKHAVAQADLSQFEGRTVYGCLVSSDSWRNMSITEVPYGIHSFTIGGKDAPAPFFTDMTYSFKTSAWGRGNFYGIVPLDVMGVLNGSRHIQIDTNGMTETSNVMHDTSEGSYSLILCAMAYDQTDDTFYGYRYKDDLSGLDWVKVNPSTSQYEAIAAYRGKTVVLTLAPTPGGEMYYIDVEGDLYTVNKQTGRTSLVGNTGVQPAPYDQCMVWDNRSGSFLWAALSSEGSVLYSVNPETAETKRVAKFGNNEQFVGIYITDSEALPAAPAAAGRPQLKFVADGDLEGNITFTVPSKMYSGSPLSGKVDMDVWLDGRNIVGRAYEPGEAVSLPVALEEGNHYIDITASTSDGWSPFRWIYSYAGFDTPLPPANPTMEFADNVNKVSWTAPSGGVNKGYVDFGALTYDVVRMPGNVQVASGIRETYFSEPTPEALQAYYYVITATNRGHVSAKAETNRVLCGDAFPVPYSQSFEERVVFDDFFTVVDNNGDGQSWRYGYSGEIRFDYIRDKANPLDADEWLILPKVSLREGMKYRFTMNMKTFVKTCPEDFEILIGSGADDLSSYRTVAKETAFTDIATEFGDYTADFYAGADGDYNLAVRYCSPFDGDGSLLMVRSVAIDPIGLAGAPAKVSGLTVIPDADDQLEATVTFTAPETDLAGNPLSELDNVTLWRGRETDPVHIFDRPQPGEVLSWTDRGVQGVGIHTYKAAAANSAGMGESVSAQSFIGIYTAPYKTDFTDKEVISSLWTAEDNFTDNDNEWYGWKWADNALGKHYECYYYLTSPKPTRIWLFSPKLKLEDNTVYTIAYTGSFAVSNPDSDIEWQIAAGAEPDSESMVKIEDIKTGFLKENLETVLVNRDGGRYNIGFGVTGAEANDYFSANLFDFAVTRRTSAFAPCRMTGYRSQADSNGELKTSMRFFAPDTDWYGDDLDPAEGLTVKVFRGKDATIPAHTVEVLPGEKVEWTDSNALHGFNYYRITCANAHGEGECLLDTLYVGRDRPDLVGNLSIKSDADNADAILSWNIPEAGENGGIVLESETKYNVYAYNPQSGELTLLASDIDTPYYRVAQNCRGKQQQFYYAVAAVNTEGEGGARATSIVLGTPYALPFAESFSNAAVSTGLWQVIPMVEGATSAGIDNPVSQSYNGCSGPQDNDGGCAYFYNGYQYEAPAGALLVSPKICPDSDGVNTLSFWAYHYQEPAEYVTAGEVHVAVSADDTPAEIIQSFTVGGDKETGWTQHSVNLDKYRSASHLTFVLMGITPGWQDVLYVDNIRMDADRSGMLHPASDPEAATKVYDLNGLRIAGDRNPASGRIIIRDGRKYLNPNT